MTLKERIELLEKRAIKADIALQMITAQGFLTQCMITKDQQHYQRYTTVINSLIDELVKLEESIPN
jgi:hypothetical protein